MQQSVGAVVQEEAELVGFPAVARRAVGPGVELMILDHVLHPAAGAIDLLTEQFGTAGKLVTTKRMSEPFDVASTRAMTLRARDQLPAQ